MSSMRALGEKKTVRIGNVVLGEGMPKICVPVMGKGLEEIREAARRAVDVGADVIELRIDSLESMPAPKMAVEACRSVRDEAEGIPLLFTLRTERDGGAGSADKEAYEALLKEVAKSGACEAIDCELSVGDEAFARIVRAAHDAGAAVVGSSHEFGLIGDMNRAAGWLRRQAALGADVVKAAVMTRTKEEALEAALVMTRAGGQIAAPMIAIAMGPAGVLTRIAGACMGSCLTFGTAGESSAPGQIDAGKLRQVLEIIDTAIL